MGEQKSKAGDGGGESMWAKEGNWTHRHRVVRERMISRGFKERGNITITTERAVRDTNEISRKDGRGKC